MNGMDAANVDNGEIFDWMFGVMAALAFMAEMDFKSELLQCDVSKKRAIPLLLKKKRGGGGTIKKGLSLR